MMPATMPAASWFDASSGPSSDRLWTTKVSGSAPYFSEFARLLACSWSKLPEISARPPVIGWSLDGSDSTLPSSTIASRCWSPMLVFCWPAILVVTSANC